MMSSLWDTIDALTDLQRALDATLTSDWLGADEPRAGGAFPPINVFRQGHDFVVVAQIPGVAKRDLDVQFDANQVRLCGRREIDYGADAELHRRERGLGAFDRSLRFPVQIDAEGAKAEYRDGILAVFVPRAGAERPRTIDVP